MAPRCLFVTLGLVLLATACAQKQEAPPAAIVAPPPPPPPPAAPSGPQTTNAAGVAIIKESEGLRLEAYQHLDGWFIGYGHAIGPKPGARITEAEAESLLRDDLSVCEKAIRDSVTVPVSDNEFAAMASLCYSIGWQRFVDSTVVKQINAGDRQGAANAFMMWNKGTVNGERVVLPLLEDRRKKEQALFLTP